MALVSLECNFDPEQTMLPYFSKAKADMPFKSLLDFNYTDNPLVENIGN